MKKNVFITGTSRGIGNAIKNTFETKNWTCNSHDSKILDLKDLNKVSNFCTDYFYLNNPSSLILNASINENRSFENLNLDNLEMHFKINLFSSISIIQAALPYFKKQNFGRIVLIGSIWSTKSRAGKSAYSMTKSSLIGLKNTLSIEFSEYNILTNIVSPGFINTEMTERNLNPDLKNSFKEKLPLKRFGEVNEISNIVYFLGSEENSYITGEEIKVDGGYSIV